MLLLKARRAAPTYSAQAQRLFPMPSPHEDTKGYAAAHTTRTMWDAGMQALKVRQARTPGAHYLVAKPAGGGGYSFTPVHHAQIKQHLIDATSLGHEVHGVYDEAGKVHTLADLFGKAEAKRLQKVPEWVAHPEAKPKRTRKSVIDAMNPFAVNPFAPLLKADDDVSPSGEKAHGPLPEGARWITVHPNGKDAPGHPVLIVPSAHREGAYHVIGGSGGKLNHMEIHLNPQKWAETTKVNRANRRTAADKLGIENQAQLKRARGQSKEDYISRIAEAMGWDYSPLTEEEARKQTTSADGKTNKSAANRLMHQHLNTWLKKANTTVANLRRDLTVSADIDLAGYGKVDSSTDPTKATEADLDPDIMAGQARHYREMGEGNAARLFQQALDSYNGGDYDRAVVALTHAKRAAGEHDLRAQDIVAPQPTDRVGGQSGLSDAAMRHAKGANRLDPAAIEQRVETVSDEIGGATPEQAPAIAETSKKEIGALENAKAALAKGDLTKASNHLVDADRWAHLREKFSGDLDAYDRWKAARAALEMNRGLVDAIKLSGGEFGTAGLDGVVADMAKSRALLAARAEYEKRNNALKKAAASLDPEVIRTVVGQDDTSDTQFEDAKGHAFEVMREAVERAGKAQVAADLAHATDDPTAFMADLGYGFAKDQTEIVRYVQYGQQSAFDLLGHIVSGTPVLTPEATRVLGAKGASRLLAQHLANTQDPATFRRIAIGLEDYHKAREFDVANGALAAAKATLAAASKHKMQAEANIDNLTEASRYNQLRLEAIDDVLATLGASYGELNATAELNFALEGVTPGAPKALLIDGRGMDTAHMIKVATALGLDREDFRIVGRNDEEASGKRGIQIDARAVPKLFAAPPEGSIDRFRRLQGIRRGDRDEAGWLPPMFAKRPSSSFEPPPDGDRKGGDEAAAALRAKPEDAMEAVARTLAEQPALAAAYTPHADLTAAQSKAIRKFYLANAGKGAQKQQDATGRQAQPPDRQPIEDAPPVDVFGSPLASGERDKPDARWGEFVRQCDGPENAITLVQDVMRGKLTDGFAKHFASAGKTNLQATQEPLRFGRGERVSLGGDGDRLLGELVQRQAKNFAAGGFTPIKDMSLSGKFVSQQRSIKQLLESGGLNGGEGGRLGGFLGPGCIRADTPIYDPVLDETRTVHEWLVRGLPFNVRAYDEVTGCEVVGEASVPFIKDYAMMYAVALANGETIHVTAAHRFLTPEGWRYLRDLTPGAPLLAAPRGAGAPARREPHDAQGSMSPDPTHQRADDARASAVHLSPRTSLQDCASWLAPQPPRDAPASTTACLARLCVDAPQDQCSVASGPPTVSPASRALPSSLYCAGGLSRPPQRSAPSLLRTSWEPDQSVSRADDRRSFGTPTGLPGRCLPGCRPGDGQSLPPGAVALAAPPSLGDVRAHTLPRWPQDGPGAVPEYSRACPSCGHLSTPHSSRPSSGREDSWLECCAACGSTTPYSALPQAILRWPHRSRPKMRQDGSGRQMAQAAMSSASCPSVILIDAITPSGMALVYDLTVERYHNYIVFSTISHNSGKTVVGIGALTSVIAQGKARKGVFAVPSAVQGQFAQEFTSKIDPSSGLTWHINPGGDSADRQSGLSGKDHVYVTTHQSLRDDAVRSVAELWGIPKAKVGRRFNLLSRAERASVIKQAADKAGWGERLDFFSIDEGHEALNREGKKNSLMANVFDAMSDNATYYLPTTGTPIKNDSSEIYDWLTKLRPDEFPEEGRTAWMRRYKMIQSQGVRHRQFRDDDRRVNAGDPKNWINSAAAEALQREVGGNFFATAVPHKVPVNYRRVPVSLSDEGNPRPPAEGATLPQLMASGHQKAAYDRVAQLEAVIRRDKVNGTIGPEAVAALRELTTVSGQDKAGNEVMRDSFASMPRGGKKADDAEDQPTETAASKRKGFKVPEAGSPEEMDRATQLAGAVGMLRDAAYDRILHDTKGGNAKTKALTNIVGQYMQRTAADDPGEETGAPGIIFARSQAAVRNITAALRERYGDDLVLDITGKDSSKSKVSKKNKFQPGGGKRAKLKILVMSDAMSAGVDLPRAEWVLHYDVPTTAKTHEQRSARAIRAITKHPVEVTSLVSDTPYEQRRLARMDDKGSLADVAQNAAEVLDDTSLAGNIDMDRHREMRHAMFGEQTAA